VRARKEERETPRPNFPKVTPIEGVLKPGLTGPCPTEIPGESQRKLYPATEISKKGVQKGQKSFPGAPNPHPG